MAKRMLIDASHPEETRVVVLSGNRLEEFDYESATRKQLKGNIYLAKVTRVEPSLQAAFVEYGGNRHGFLPFSEIHPDYYRIPVADRKALLAAEAKLKAESAELDLLGEAEPEAEPAARGPSDGGPEGQPGVAAEGGGEPVEGEAVAESAGAGEVELVAGETGVDTLDEDDDVEDAARRRAQLLRKYKIQEVIKRRQVMLVQVTKEERGTKGAALTTYLSLPGRYCVLMPNTAKGGGISRKISSSKDRRRLKSILEDLEMPEGVAVIVRTAGSERTKAEIRRDYDYLLRLWDEIRSATLASTAPSLIYEEANLIKRATRDLYQTDMDEILVEGEDGYKAAKAFMKSLMPSYARKVKLYKDLAIPLFYRYQVETQIDAMHNSTVQLRSGGYIVINMTEALVAIDVNSGKATRERHIEETAYKTNLEAADEIARQLRLRDLAGLIVIDFIDMEDARHNRGVERKLKEAMRMDRARIQLGRISPFGLLEMSRQRLRPSLIESSTVVCPHCHASGYVRTTMSMALHVLRGLEEEGIRRGAGEVAVAVTGPVALHILNEMRGRLVEVEQRYGLHVRVVADDGLIPPDYRLERLAAQAPAARAEAEREAAAEGERPEGERGEGERAERRRARGRRRRKKGEPPAPGVEAEQEVKPGEEPAAEEAETLAAETPAEAAGEEKPKRRRRGKRGGRRRSRRQRDEVAAAAPAGNAPSEPGEHEPAAPEAGEAEPGEHEPAAPEAGEAEPGEAEPERAAAEQPANQLPAPEEPWGVREVRLEPAPGPESAPPAERSGQSAGGRPAESAPDSPAHGAAPRLTAQSDDEGAEGREAEPNGERQEAGEDADRPKRRGWWQRWG